MNLIEWKRGNIKVSIRKTPGGRRKPPIILNVDGREYVLGIMEDMQAAELLLKALDYVLIGNGGDHVIRNMVYAWAQVDDSEDEE